MSNFMLLKQAMQKQFNIMAKGELFVTDVDKDESWDTYLGSFKEGTNPIYIERTEHDCQCCKQFIRACGNVVSLVGNVKQSIWDIDIGGDYQVVADAMSAAVKAQKVKNRFRHYQKDLGTNFNHQSLLSGDIIKWKHFYYKLPSKFVGDIIKWEHFYYKLPSKFVMAKTDIGTFHAKNLAMKDVSLRGFNEITLDSVDTIIELIGQKSLYRGDEYLRVLKAFLINKKVFDRLSSDEEKDNYAWNSLNNPMNAPIRNSVIGTLLVDLSNGVDFEKAVRAFEVKVAPANYKRPTALITKSMIENAQKKVMELGISDSLQRRYAKMEDITINNVLFANREAKQEMDVFDELLEATAVKIGTLGKVEEVSIDTFINDIVPKTESIELLFENKHINNLVSLVAPINKESRPILKWGNNFSWAYNGEVTDSIKERVKKAGGNVTGALRCSLSWFNPDDLDIHLVEPDGCHIYYGNKNQVLNGITLDVDMNAGGISSATTPVENITWAHKNKIKGGIHKIYIHNYTKRSTSNIGFNVEIEYEGNITSFHYSKAVPDGKQVVVAEFEYNKNSGIKFINSLPSTQASKEAWNINTEKFQPVSVIMNSPNHWDGEETGNKHWFFMLKNCKNDEKARGFFNEFLKGNLIEHRKVFEVLGSKMKTEKSDEQLSGLGFSSTQRNHVYCKVTGSFTRTVKINF